MKLEAIKHSSNANSKNTVSDREKTIRFRKLQIKKEGNTKAQELKKRILNITTERRDTTPARINRWMCS